MAQAHVNTSIHVLTDQGEYLNSASLGVILHTFADQLCSFQHHSIIVVDCLCTTCKTEPLMGPTTMWFGLTCKVLRNSLYKEY